MLASPLFISTRSPFIVGRLRSKKVCFRETFLAGPYCSGMDKRKLNRKLDDEHYSLLYPEYFFVRTFDFLQAVIRVNTLFLVV